MWCMYLATSVLYAHRDTKAYEILLINLGAEVENNKKHKTHRMDKNTYVQKTSYLGLFDFDVHIIQRNQVKLYEIATILIGKQV